MSAAEFLPSDHPGFDPHIAGIAGQSSTDRGQCPSDAQILFAPVGDSPAETIEPSTSMEGPSRLAPPSPVGPILDTTPSEGPGRPEDVLLTIYADALDDLEAVRIATENRVRSLRDVKGMEGSPEEARMLGIVEGIARLEHQAELELRRALRKHPLGPWVKATMGVGEKQGGRLLAAVGDPYWHPLFDRPRLVSELWAFAGLHVVHRDSQPSFELQSTNAVGVAPRRAKGQRANWNPTIKMRAFLVADACTKKRCEQCTKAERARRDDPLKAAPYAAPPANCNCETEGFIYRAIYDAGRVKYADAVHHVECVRCGPKGKPALVDSPLSAKHQHARAIRLIMKKILRDLWAESKRLHEMEATA